MTKFNKIKEQKASIQASEIGQICELNALTKLQHYTSANRHRSQHKDAH